MRPAVPISGSIGRWTAEAGDETLPVLHTTWWDVPTSRYFDPMTDADINGAKYRDYVTRLKEGDKCIIQKDADAETLRRRGYVGVFRYSDLQLGDDGSIGLNIIARVADPKK